MRAHNLGTTPGRAQPHPGTTSHRPTLAMPSTNASHQTARQPPAPGLLASGGGPTL
ncbi:hypothetical protein D187_001232 [Cystobacter fuscus DSM 2262]|uniref:Uncharacterized protein n=1 Tax=Cystobacter fuscus (strain ATCC 25194 / DSM 2262 / NBRC 100088 / M29) TaxID=1242864 RepID=S9QJH7_CYSF2|nr:hypothetical protein D187_001232 [Cystobacter fuscus DSM 2262]